MDERRFLTLSAAIAAAVTLLTGCDAKVCQNYGFQPGTAEFGQCLAEQQRSRDASTAASSAAAAAVLNMRPQYVAPSPPVQCIGRRVGSTYQTTCQ